MIWLGINLNRIKRARVTKSVWLFPLVVFLLLILLTTLKLSGSSVGIYHEDMYGSSHKDSDIVAGSPRSVRSDEWEWQTSMAQAQAAANYPRVNNNLGSGQNMEVIVDVAYKNWSVIFKPQNLAFFLLPFEYAFAFKWWFLAALLVVSAYFFVLAMLPKKRFLAALLSISLLYSPFVQWWYQTITIAPLFYGLFMATVTMKIWDKKTKNPFLWSVLLAYLLVCFSLVLYPPFQIPCILVLGFFLLGYFMEKGYINDRAQLLRGIKLTLFPVLSAIVIIGAFLLLNKAAIEATQNSIYPGKRVGTSGHYDAQVFFGNFLQTNLQFSRKAKNFVSNQSEASNFLLTAPFLSIPIIFIIVKQRRRYKHTDWPLLLVTVVFLLFLVRLFVPKTDLLFKFLLLGSVPNARLIIGIGLASFLQIILLIRHFSIHKTGDTKILAIVTASFAFAVNMTVGLLTRADHPGYVHIVPLIVFLALVPAVIIGLLLAKKAVPALIVFIVFSILTCGAVNPLSRGAGSIYESAISKAISSTSSSDKSARWAVVDNLVYENLPTISGAPSITGTYAYPQYELWRSSNTISNQQATYNRYAHTLVRFEDINTRLVLKQPDYFEIVSSPCSQFFKDMKVRFFLAEKDHSLEYTCLNLRQTVEYPNKRFYILELK